MTFVQLLKSKQNIRIASISPGIVDGELLREHLPNDTQEIEDFVNSIEWPKDEDIAIVARKEKLLKN